MINKMKDSIDNDNFAILVSIMTASTIIGCAIIMGASLIAASFTWGWIGFVSVVGIIILAFLTILLGRDE